VSLESNLGTLIYIFWELMLLALADFSDDSRALLILLI